MVPWTFVVLSVALVLYCVPVLTRAQVSVKDYGLRWGSYRPNVYFGVKARVADSPLLGLMWYDPADGRLDNLRHDCRQEDQLDRYGWLVHDGVRFGIHEVLDRRLAVNMTVQYINLAEDGAAREQWVARVSAKKYRGKRKSRHAAPKHIGLMWYVALQEPKQSLDLPKLDSMGLPRSEPLTVKAAGSTQFTLHAALRGSGAPIVLPSGAKITRKNKGSKNKIKLDKLYYLGMRAPGKDVWSSKDMVKKLLQRKWEEKMNKLLGALMKEKGPEYRITQRDVLNLHVIPTLPNVVEKRSNVVVFQAFLQPPFEIDFALDEGQPAASLDSLVSQADEAIARSRAQHSARFEEAFGLANRKYTPLQRQFAQAALGNLVGGIGHFHGRGRVQLSPTSDPTFGPTQTLLSCVPSRSFFPRGFMWDEGFHQLLVSRWDIRLSQSIISHWMSLVDKDGWLPREQILGAEARSRVPEKFQVQKPSIANPPTIIMAIKSMVEANKDDPSMTAFLQDIFPAVLRQTQWYLRTQASDTPHTFRWHERTKEHCLASGLDDYPRGTVVTPGEGHVDLHCWMIMLCKLVSRLADSLAESSEDIEVISEYHNTGREYRSRAQQLADQLDPLFWNSKTKMYADFIVNATSGKKLFINHVGYVSLFPLLLRAVPGKSPKLKRIMDVMGDQKQLWSSWGLCSLSKKDRLFGKGENYWKGNIWINVNYLAAAALHHYAHPEHYEDTDFLRGPYQAQAATLYKKLRGNLVNNLYKEYRNTGYLWEQYRCVKKRRQGSGLRSHPFTGWSALVVLLMAEQY